MSDNRKEINDFIRGLQYDPEEVLVFDGNTVTNKVPKSGSMDGDRYVVIEREKCSLEGDFDVSVPTVNKSVTYPGALLIADSNLIEGNPNTVGLHRGSVKLTLDLPGMTSDNSSVIPCADFATVSGEINRILDDWYEKYPSYTSIPADMSFVSDLVYDEKEMQIKFGLDATFMKNEIGIDFNAIKSRKKSVFIARYKQIYYSAYVAPIEEPADAFADGVTLEELKQAGVSNETPPAYVGAVTYGREIFVKFESSLQSYELEALVKGKVTADGVDIDGETSSKDKALREKVSCSVIALGGGAETMECLFSDDEKLKALNQIIQKGISLSKANPAFPILYKTVFLKDNKTAKMHGTSEYLLEKVSIYENGELSVKHTGAYIAKFHISWQKITDYNDEGQEILADEEWKENGKKKTAGFQSVIPLAGNVRNIHIKSQGETGLVWDNWHTSFDKSNIALRPKMEFSISGTTLNQKAKLK